MTERTHWKDCHLEHHDCALAKIEELEANLKSALDHIKKDAIEIADLNTKLAEAPHGRGCKALYDKNAPNWMEGGECNCWKASITRNSPQFKAVGFVNKVNGCTHTHYNELLPDGKRILYLATDEAMKNE